MTTVVVTPIEWDGTEVELRGDAYHHLFRVKRVRAGESVRVVDGAGRARGGVVARVDRAHGVIALAGAQPSLEPALRLELLVAPPKLERAAWMVEKATEIGVAAVRFVATDRAARGERELNPTQLARLRRIAVAAVEQCGRSVVPEITGVHELAGSLEQKRSEGIPTIVLDAGGEAIPPLDGVDRADGAGGDRLCLLVGPEGGWSDDEQALFAASKLPRWSLGERALRVETAATVSAGAALALRGGTGRRSS